MAEKVNYKKVLTPIGTASYPYLTTPDTKFVADGEYKCDLIVPADEAAKFIKIIDAEIAAAVEQARKDNPKHAKKITVKHKPYDDEVDDDGNETGNVVFKLKQKAKFTSKKTGKVYEKTIPLFDAAGKRVTDINIGGGSKIRANVELRHYYSAVDKAAGVSLRIEAVQVIELVAWNGGGTAESYGFDSVDGGYTADDDDNEFSRGADASNEDASDDEDSDLY